ncbi:MAG: V-type ATPase subunit [Nitrososphaerota archaeon]|nr:V-type ATPase subunit [Nitrososphaerota archaeon]MDG7023972.1 V-type ATPase subunit [Nitrososphaerota archaeon]
MASAPKYPGVARLSSRVYIGTKAFALKGSLLDASAVQKLAESTSLDELVNRLRGTSYADSLSALTPPFNARRIELALRERLAEVHHSVVQGASKYSILQLYYLKDIAWDLKLILKARALGRTYEETVKYLDMKAEELVGRRDLIVKVLSAKDVTEAVTMLSGTEFFSDVEKALGRYASKGEVRFFDVYIDHAVLASISKDYSLNSKTYAARPPNANGVEEMVGLDIDAYNVLAVLRSKLWGLSESDIQELLISPANRVQLPALMSMARADSVTEAVKLLEPSYHFALQGAQNEEELIDLVEDCFAKLAKGTATLAFVWQGLGPGTMLAMIKLMELEVSNLAAVAIGVEAGIEPKKILSKLRV